jgi:transcriptional regulator with XRE-family HTH domain
MVSQAKKITESKSGTKGRATDVDLHVGARLRMLRNLRGITQEALADKLGVTFQQLQKYERGANRMSASRLFDISSLLGVPIDYFFEGTAESGNVAKEAMPDVTPYVQDSNAPVYGFAEATQAAYNTVDISRDAMMRKETAVLLKSFYGIKDPEVRRGLIDLAESLSQAFADSLTEAMKNLPKKK